MTLPENAIPAGSLPPEQNPTGEPLPGQATKAAIDQTAKDQLILGKFKTSDEVVPAYQELEKDHGRLGSEVGQLRKDKEMLMGLINRGAAQQPNQQPATQEPAQDYDKLLEETTNAVEAGDLSVGEGLKKVASLTAQKMAVLAKETYSQLDSARTSKEILSQFQKDNPEFNEALNSGALDAIRAQNPMHDNLSAFYEWKSAKTQADAAQAVKDAYEKGKNEMAELAKGADATGRVLGKSGSEARVTNTNTGPVTEADKIQGMMGALKSARGGG